MNTSNHELLDKLQVKCGHLLVLNAPEDFAEALKPLPEDITLLGDMSEQAECVLVFVHNKADVDKIAPQAISTLKEDGLLWFAYPKGSSKVNTDINRDRGWECLNEAHYRPVRQVSIDDTWSALRFRHEDKVKSRKGSS